MLLHRDGDGWRPSAGHGFASLGLRPPDERVDPADPLPRAAVLGLLRAPVRLAASAWSAPLLPAIPGAIADEDGLVLILTSTVNPGEPALTGREVRRLLSNPDAVVLGWVALPQVLVAHRGHRAGPGHHGDRFPGARDRHGPGNGSDGLWNGWTPRKAAGSSGGCSTLTPRLLRLSDESRGWWR